MTNHNIQSLGRQVPSDWKIQRLGDLGEVRGRVGWKGYTKKDLVQSGALAIGGRQMGSNCRLDLSEPVHLSQAKFVESPEIAIKRDDILIAQRGTLGKIALVDQEIGDATINPSLVIFRPRLICSVYATYFLASTAGQLQIEEATSKTGVPMISQKQIENMLIARPSCEREEALIAEVLNDIEHQLSALELELDKKSQVKQAAMQKLLTGKRRLPGFEGEWEVKRLGDVAQIKKGQLITSSTLMPGDVPVIAGGKQPAYFHSTANRLGRTITISASGASAGYIALYNGPIFASDCSTIGELESYCLDFVYFQLQRNQQAIYKAQTGGAQPHIHAKDLNPIAFSFPTLAEQTAIATVLSDIDTELAILESRRDKARVLKQGMMQQLLTGKIRLR